MVADNGPGIPAELVDRIFEPYAQFPDNPARAGSAGLGLYIAKEIVEAHNGRIYVHSVPGRGSNFIVEIPLREQALG
jgi:signal transduction histidine kinase